MNKPRTVTTATTPTDMNKKKNKKTMSKKKALLLILLLGCFFFKKIRFFPFFFSRTEMIMELVDDRTGKPVSATFVSEFLKRQYSLPQM